MTRKVPFGVKCIASIYVTLAVACTLIASACAFELLFGDADGGLFGPIVGLWLAHIMVACAVMMPLYGLIGWGLLKANRIALFFAFLFSFIQVVGAGLAVFEGDWDVVFAPAVIFHAVTAFYLAFNKDVRHAFGR